MTLAVLLAYALFGIFVLIVLPGFIYWMIASAIRWPARIRHLLAQDGFTVRHLERRWLTRGPFPDMRRPGTKGAMEWLIRFVAEGRDHQPHGGWIRWRRRLPWESADRWAIHWDTLPASGVWDGTAASESKGLSSRVFYAVLVGLGAVVVMVVLTIWRSFDLGFQLRTAAAQKPGAGGGAGGGSGAAAIEESLARTGRAEVYSIYFAFNSAAIQEESEPTLREIAEVPRRHPEWKLAIEGTRTTSQPPRRPRAQPARRTREGSVMTLGDLLAYGLAAVFAAPLQAQESDVLARSRATYASLKSYSDTGTVDVEFGPAAAPLRERHAFKTFFRAPRHFYFEFNEDKRAGGERFVVWSDLEAFHTWWSTTGLENTFPKGQGAAAFMTGARPTQNALLQIAPLLFPAAGLTGTLNEFTDASVAGNEDVGGRPCHKLVGTARSVYPATGRVTNVRRTTVWIDAATGLVRKVFEDTAQGTPAGTVARVTTTFEPVANPVLDDARFHFTVPASR